MAGSYRLKLTADGGSKTLAFTVTGGKPVTPPPVTPPPVTPPAVVVPQAGHWESTSPQWPRERRGPDGHPSGFTVGSGPGDGV